MVEDATIVEKRKVITDRLADATPKCANCKWWTPAFAPQRRAQKWYEPKNVSGLVVDSSLPALPVPGKGICMEPAVAKVYQDTWPPKPFLVTDLALCSQWESMVREEGK